MASLREAKPEPSSRPDPRPYPTTPINLSPSPWAMPTSPQLSATLFRAFVIQRPCLALYVAVVRPCHRTAARSGLTAVHFKSLPYNDNLRVNSHGCNSRCMGLRTPLPPARSASTI